MKNIRFYGFFLLFIAFLSVFFFNTKNASAVVVDEAISPFTGSRSYQTISTGEIVRSASWNGQTGSVVLGGYPARFLYGFNLGKDVSFSDSSASSLYYSIVLNIQSSSTQGWLHNIDTLSVTCAIWDGRRRVHTYSAQLEVTGSVSNNWMYAWRCNGTTTEYTSVSQVRVYFGNENGSVVYGYANQNDIIYTGASYHFDTSKDPSFDQLEQIHALAEQIRDGVGQTTDAINNQTIILNNSIQSTTSAVDNLTQATQDAEDGEQSRWEADKQERSDKEDELENQAGDLSISAQNPGNPFENLFNSSGCQSLPTISGWFNMSEPMQVCSPYPDKIRPVLEFVSSAIVIGLLLRVYFKQLKGGYAS